MCEVHESINTSIKGYLTRKILKMYWRNIMQSTPWTMICSITIGSIYLNSINFVQYDFTFMVTIAQYIAQLPMLPLHDTTICAIKIIVQ